MTERRLLEAIHDHHALVQGVALELELIASNLAAVGLTKPAESIKAAVAPLRESATEVRRAYNLDLSGQLSHSRHMTGLLLKAGLNGNLAPSKAKEPV